MIEIKLLYYIMESTVDSYEKRNTIYIYDIWFNVSTNNEILMKNIRINTDINI